jgi:hypothetical protein
MSMTKLTDLKLGDVVQLDIESYRDATVKQIKDGEITLFRPYVQTADFSYTGGVMCYVGIEEFKIPLDANRAIRLVRKGPTLR